MQRSYKKIKEVTRLNRLNFFVETDQLQTKDEEQSFKEEFKKYLQNQFKSNSPLFSLTIYQNSHEVPNTIELWPNNILSSYETRDFDVIFLFLTPSAELMPKGKILSRFNIKNKTTINVYVKQNSTPVAFAA